jgi:membrane protein
LVVEVYAAALKHRVADGAATLAFYTMLAAFPGAIFGLSLLPYLPIPQLEHAIFDLLYQLLPQSTADLFTGTVQHIVSERNSRLLSFGLLFAIWSGSSGFYAVMQQLNAVAGVREERPFWKARGVALGLMLMFFALLVVTFALVIFGGLIQDGVANKLGWSPGLRTFFAAFRWLVIVFALLSAFALVYRIAPNTRQPLRLFSLGNAFAVAGFLSASFALRLYVSHFPTFDGTYGGLGAAIVLLLWLFLGGWVLLMGGVINNVVDAQRRHARAPNEAKSDASQLPNAYDGDELARADMDMSTPAL